MLVSKLGCFYNSARYEHFSASDKVFPASKVHPQYKHLSRSELLRDNGAYMRLGGFIQRWFSKVRKKGVKNIRFDAAGNGNQRYDVALGIINERILTIAKRLKIEPKELLNPGHPYFSRVLAKVLNRLPYNYNMSATDKDRMQINSGINAPVLDSTFHEAAKRLGLTGLYNSVIYQTPQRLFTVDPSGLVYKGGAMCVNPYLKRVVGSLDEGDAFQLVQKAPPVDVVVSSNWLGHIATTIDEKQRTPEERATDIAQVRGYLDSVANQISSKGLLALGCVDLSWGVPKLLPEGKFRPVAEPDMLMDYSPLSEIFTTPLRMQKYLDDAKRGVLPAQKKAPFVFERI